MGKMRQLVSRATWQVNRSPLAPLVKFALRARHRGAIRHRREVLNGLPENERISRVANALMTDGYAVVTDFVDATRMQALAETATDNLKTVEEATSKQKATGKAFWVRLSDVYLDGGRMPTENPYVQFALDPQILSVVSKAMGELPHLDGVLITYSRHTPNALAYSQLWHKDHDDVRTIKLFVYLTDVNDIDDGPFTFLPKQTSEKFGYRRRSHLPDEDVFSKVPKDSVISIKGPKLTAFIVETSRCMHMGSRVAPDHSRLMYTATFIQLPRMYPQPKELFRFSGKESAIERVVLTPVGAAFQRQAR